MERLGGHPSFNRFSHLKQGRWMGRSMQELRFRHRPRNFLQTYLSPLCAISRPSSKPNLVQCRRWISTQITSTQAQNNLELSQLSRVNTYVGLLEYLRKNHFIEGILEMRFRILRAYSSTWRPDTEVRQVLERKLSLLPASQLFEMPAKDRLEILSNLRLLKFSNLSFVGKVKEWLMEVKRMHEEQRIESDEGRVLLCHLLYLMPHTTSQQTLKQELEELSKSDLIQKKDFQSLSEYLSYLSVSKKINSLLQMYFKDDFSDLLKFQDEINELPVLESLRLFEHQRSLLRQGIDHGAKELISALIRKSLSSNLVLSVSDVDLIMDISEAIGTDFSIQDALELLRSMNSLKMNIQHRIKHMIRLSNALKSFQSCDKELASLLKEKINAIITAAFWKGNAISTQMSHDFFTFVKNIDSAFLTSSSHILINNVGKELNDISRDDQEIILSTLPIYFQGDQVEANQSFCLLKLADLNITIDYLPESTKTLMMEVFVNDLQKKDSPVYTARMIVIFSKLQYGWNDFPRHVQEICAESLCSDSLKFDESNCIGLTRCLPILCFDSEQAMDASLDSPLMKVTICLLKGICRNSENHYNHLNPLIDWLKTLPLDMQTQLLSRVDAQKFPTSITKPSFTTEQSKFIKECKDYLSKHLVQAQDMKDRKIMISGSNSPVKSFPMHLTVECNGKVIACIQLLKERIKLRGGEIKMDREDKLRDYLCYHTYGNVPIIHIEFEDYSKLEVGEDVFKEIENVVRSLIP
eukprot:gene9149-9921_t